MNTKHACFISFPLGVPDAEALASDLYVALKARLEMYDKAISVFFCERAERERRGTDWEDWITPALCHSAMMIAVCPPSYFSSSPSCVREFLAMEKLIDRRKELMSELQADPPFLVGLQMLPNHNIPELSIHKVEDFCFYSMETTPLRRKKASKAKVAVLADYVWKAWCEYTRPAHQSAIENASLCTDFALDALPEKYMRGGDNFPRFGGVAGA